MAQSEDEQTGGPVEVIYYTDPLCCWSWAMEPHWRRLIERHSERFFWRYRMGGLIPDWQSYNDPVNAVSRPAQMGPIWFQVRHMTGAPLDDSIWMVDPPASSYPACLAVKAAERQSPGAADLLLSRLRLAVMAERQNIAREDVVLMLAEEVEAAHPADFDAARFAADFRGEEAKNAFREDLMETRFREIGRFPTLTFRARGESRSIVLMGYRPFEVLEEALLHAAGVAKG